MQQSYIRVLATALTPLLLPLPVMAQQTELNPPYFYPYTVTPIEGPRLSITAKLPVGRRSEAIEKIKQFAKDGKWAILFEEDFPKYNGFQVQLWRYDIHFFIGNWDSVTRNIGAISNEIEIKIRIFDVNIFEYKSLFPRNYYGIYLKYLEFYLRDIDGIHISYN